LRAGSTKRNPQLKGWGFLFAWWKSADVCKGNPRMRCCKILPFCRYHLKRDEQT
jgi:hypothetical protein